MNDTDDLPEKATETPTAAARAPLLAEIERLNTGWSSVAAREDELRERAEAAEQERDRARIELNRMHNNELPGGWTAVLESERLRRIEAERERDTLKTDAERYRWIRSNHRGRLFAIEADSFYGDAILFEDHLDYAIDAAMKGKE